MCIHTISTPRTPHPTHVFHSLTAADGLVRSESEPGDVTQGQSVSRRYPLSFIAVLATLLTPFFSKEELPVRLAHRVKELEKLPHNLSEMPSIIKVRNWYAQSFEVSSDSLLCSCAVLNPFQELINFPPMILPPDIRRALHSGDAPNALPESIPNPSIKVNPVPTTGNSNGSGYHKLKLRVPMERR